MANMLPDLTKLESRWINPVPGQIWQLSGSFIVFEAGGVRVFRHYSDVFCKRNDMQDSLTDEPPQVDLPVTDR